MSNALVPASPAVLAARADKEYSFDYELLSVADLQVTTEKNPSNGKLEVKEVLVKEEPLEPSKRFWTSLYVRFGFNERFFDFFDYPEVFNRIKERKPKDQMRLCIQRDETGKGTVMAVSNPDRPIVVYGELVDLLSRYRAESMTYHNGVVESVHTPRAGANAFQVAGDDFVNRFVMQTPVDGYGMPNIYLSLLRMICSNGLVGYSKDFKSSVQLGKGADDVGHSLTRMLDGFNNDEGYSAIRSRVEASAKSWASVRESIGLYDTLVRMVHKRMIDHAGPPPREAKLVSHHLSNSSMGMDESNGVEGAGSPILAAFHQLTGDTSRLYGLANLDALSDKRKRTLPVRATVYDLINFATEVSTHYATPAGAREVQSWIGTLITDEFDMENTKDRFADFKDFYMDAKMTAGVTGSGYASKA